MLKEMAYLLQTITENIFAAAKKEKKKKFSLKRKDCSFLFRI